MPTVELVIGCRTYPGVEVPDGCTVASWRQLLKEGNLGDKIAGVTRLTCFEDPHGRALDETSLMPASPRKAFIDGPSCVMGQIASSLQKMDLVEGCLRMPEHEQTVEAATSLKIRRSPTGRLGLHRNNIGTRSQDAAIACDAEASAVLSFWFDELTPDDWFRQSQALDDRIRQEFGTLHSRAAAGELAGWMDRTETCLALVVVLDQFSRNLYRGSPVASACDAQARAAANAALARGDDRTHWRTGPRRSALYLPFMHSGLVPDGSGARGVAGMDVGGSYRAARAAASLGSVGLPRLTSATPSSGVGPRLGSSGSPRHKSVSRASTMYSHASSMAGDDAFNSDVDEQADLSSARATSPSANASGTLGDYDQSPRSPGGGGRGARGSVRTNGIALPEELFGTYSKTSIDVPSIPVLTLNHEHAKRFRTMKLDAQTQQAYFRDKNAAAKAQHRYNCLVCAVPHEFSLTKGVNSAEHQHHPV